MHFANMKFASNSYTNYICKNMICIQIQIKNIEFVYWTNL